MDFEVFGGQERPESGLLGSRWSKRFHCFAGAKDSQQLLLHSAQSLLLKVGFALIQRHPTRLRFRLPTCWAEVTRIWFAAAPVHRARMKRKSGKEGCTAVISRRFAAKGNTCVVEPHEGSSSPSVHVYWADSKDPTV